jgi:hypothetical protein
MTTVPTNLFYRRDRKARRGKQNRKKLCGLGVLRGENKKAILSKTEGWPVGSQKQF